MSEPLFRPSAQEIALQGALALVLPDRPVVYSRQSEVRPPGPYSTIYIVSAKADSDFADTWIEEGPGPGGGAGLGKMPTHYDVEATVQLFRDFEATGRTAYEDAMVLSEAASLPPHQEAATALGVYYTGNGPITNIDLVVADRWEARYTFDLTFRWARLTEFDSHIIETVNVATTIT